MEERTYEILLKVMAEKTDLLEWQLNRATEENIKLRNENRELVKKMNEAEGEKENV